MVGLGIAMAAGAGATEQLHGPIEAEVVRIVDGDTVEVRARIWLGQTITTLVRLDGIDTPERRSRCAAEKDAAERATALVAEMLPAGAVVRLHGVKTGKYAGRVVAAIESASGQDVATALLDRELARPYDGRGRGGWCD